MDRKWKMVMAVIFVKHIWFTSKYENKENLNTNINYIQHCKITKKSYSDESKDIMLKLYFGKSESHPHEKYLRKSQKVTDIKCTCYQDLCFVFLICLYVNLNMSCFGYDGACNRQSN